MPIRLGKLLRRVRLLMLGVDARELGNGYHAGLDSLAILVERAVSRMKIKPRYPYCGTPVLFRFSHLAGGHPVRDDQAWKCPNCFHTTHFGIPMTREEYEREKRLRGGEYLLEPDYREDEKYMAQVRRRLRELGYLEM